MKLVKNLPIMSNAHAIKRMKVFYTNRVFVDYQHIKMHYTIDVDWPSMTSEPSLLQVLAFDPLYELENSY